MIHTDDSDWETCVDDIAELTRKIEEPKRLVSRLSGGKIVVGVLLHGAA